MTDKPYPDPPRQTIDDLDPESATTDRLIAMARGHREGRNTLSAPPRCADRLKGSRFDPLLSGGHMMSLTRALIAVISLLGWPLYAVALDPGAAVKVTPLLKTTASWNGQPLTYPAGQAEVTGLLVEIAPSGETGWHEHAVPSFGLLLQGGLEVTLKDGQVKRLRAGEALAEVVNTPHNGRNVGLEPAKIVVFYAGAEGQPLTRKAP